MQYNSCKIRLRTHAFRWCVLKLQTVVCILLCFLSYEKTYILHSICTRQKCLTLFFFLYFYYRDPLYIIYNSLFFAYLDYLEEIPSGQETLMRNAHVCIIIYTVIQ